MSQSLWISEDEKDVGSTDTYNKESYMQASPPDLPFDEVLPFILDFKQQEQGEGVC